eukprot:scaffold38357_cov54-Phaeocystis_antarctica.AAC.1
MLPRSAPGTGKGEDQGAGQGQSRLVKVRRGVRHLVRGRGRVRVGVRVSRGTPPRSAPGEV